MNQDNIESTLSQALNSYQQPHVHLPGSRRIPVPTAAAAAAAAQPSAVSHHHLVSPHNNPTQRGGSSTTSVQSDETADNTTTKFTSTRTNKPGQKFGAKKRSWVWNWFVQDVQDANIAVCDQCGKVIRRLPSDKGSPKKLSEHLRTHKIDKMTDNPGRDHMIGINNNNTNTTTNIIPGNSGQSLKSAHSGGLGNIPQHLLAEFDISQYSQIKFHKDIMRFLTDNKLPITVVKSPSFRQMVFTLRPESIEDLNELNNIYASLMEVLKNNDTPQQATTSTTAATVATTTTSSQSPATDVVAGDSTNSDSKTSHPPTWQL